MSITTDWERLSSGDINNEKGGPEPTKPEYLYAYTDSNPSSGNPGTVYTDSDTLVVGMTLYDNTGTDTGLTIGVINQDGSFDIGAPTGVDVTFSIASSSVIDTYAIDGTTYTSQQTLNLNSGTHTLVVTKNESATSRYHLKINDTVAEYYLPATIEFTVSEDYISFPYGESSGSLNIPVGTSIEFDSTTGPF